MTRTMALMSVRDLALNAYPCSFIGPPQQSKEQPWAHPQDWDDEISVPHSLHSLTTLSSNPQLSQTYTWSIFISLQLGIFEPRRDYVAAS
jgi:hypothetical protein